jgi:TIR domain
MPGIFLSYRHTDAEAWAGLLHKSLDERLPGVQIFRDIDNIPPTVKFADYIRQAVGSCDVFIALIGPSWLTATDEAGRRRLDDEKDFVRIEIATALERKIPIVPTLVGGAAMPLRNALPPEIQEMADWQNHELPNRLWKESCDRLAASLMPRLSKAAPPDKERPEIAVGNPALAQPPTPLTWYKWLGVGVSILVVAGAAYFLYKVSSGDGAAIK